MQVHPVIFRYRGPAGGAVSVVGSFNHWDPAAHPLARREGEWRVRLFLPSGTYPYAFAIDGRLVPDSDPSRALRGSLGGQYSAVIVSADPSPIRAA
jgi:1,4-alpha-glucan branching enzyme